MWNRRLMLWVVVCAVLCPIAQTLRGQPAMLGRWTRDESVRRVQLPVLSEEFGRREGDRLYLSEQEIVELALRNNLDINVERHNRLVREWDLQLPKGAYDPVGSFGFNWDRTKSPAASVLQGGTSVTEILTNYNFGYKQPFSTGTSFEAVFLGNRNRTTNFFSSLVPAIQTQFEALLRQSLLRGFRKASAEYDLEISRNNLEISDQEFRRLANEVIAQARDQFRELEFSLKDIEVKQKSMELAETVLEQNRARFEVGSAARLEVVEAEAEVESRREELIRARFTYRRAQDQLVKLITGFSDPREFTGDIIPDAPAPPAEREGESFEQLLRIAAELRPELQQSDLTIANREVELHRSRDQLKPSLELVAGYRQYGLGGTQVIRDFSQGFIDAPIVAVIPGGLGNSLSQVFSGDFYGYVMGFNLQVPIANTDARTRNAQAQIELNRAQMQKAALEQTVGLEIRDTLTQMEMNRARVQAAEAAVRAAQERLDGEQARFEVGMGTTRQLIEAQRDLLQAESVVVRARTDLAKNFSQLDQAAGRTFQRFGLVLRDAVGRNVR